MKDGKIVAMFVKAPLIFAKKTKSALRKIRPFILSNRSLAGVLIYHRVDRLALDPQYLSVSPENFDAQITFLKRNYQVLPLLELLEAHRRRRILDGSIAITFDDGYADNLLEVKPILERHGVPATFFISSGFIGSQREFWWDELERVFLGDTELPSELDISLKGNEFRRKLGSLCAQRRVYSELQPIIKRLPIPEREAVLDALFGWSGIDRDSGRASHQILTATQLRELAASDLVTIGAHTVNHPCLSELDAATQLQEIKRGKVELESLVGREVTTFSFPFGSPGDYNETTIRMAKAAGFDHCIANHNGALSNSDSSWRIPRILIRDWGMGKFSDVLEQELPSRYGWRNAVKQIGGMRRAAAAAIAGYFEAQHPASHKRPSQEPKSILHLNHLDVVGGASKISWSLLRTQLKHGLETRALCGEMRSVSTERIDLLPPRRDPLQFGLTWYQGRKGIQDILELRTLGLETRPDVQQADVVHLHNLHGGWFSPLALPRLAASRPTVWTLHDMHAVTGHCAHSLDCGKWTTGCGGCPHLDTYPSIRTDATQFNWKHKAKAYAASPMLLVSPSRWLADIVSRSMLSSHELVVVPNGIDQSIFHPSDKAKVRTQLGLPLDKTILLFGAHGGKSNSFKGGAFLEDAWIQLRDRPDILFVCVGGTSAGARENWIDVPYIEWEEEMSMYYQASDIFLYPTRADNCPLSVLESLSCATPVVSFKVGGVPELVIDGETGLLCADGDGASFIRNLKNLLDDPRLRERYSMAGLEWATKNAGLDIMHQRYMLAYQRAIEIWMEHKS